MVELQFHELRTILVASNKRERRHFCLLLSKCASVAKIRFPQDSVHFSCQLTGGLSSWEFVGACVRPTQTVLMVLLFAWPDFQSGPRHIYVSMSKNAHAPLFQFPKGKHFPCQISACQFCKKLDLSLGTAVLIHYFTLLGWERMRLWWQHRTNEQPESGVATQVCRQITACSQHSTPKEASEKGLPCPWPRREDEASLT